MRIPICHMLQEGRCGTLNKFSAPKARNAIAWGNAPGDGVNSSRALKACNGALRCRAFGASISLWMFPGALPRLLHFAPLALKKELLRLDSEDEVANGDLLVRLNFAAFLTRNFAAADQSRIATL